jgi:hypothetical protein
MKLKRLPLDIGAVFALEPFDPTQADIAPGSDVVRNDDQAWPAGILSLARHGVFSRCHLLFISIGSAGRLGA